MLCCLEATVTTYFTLGLTKYSGLIYKKTTLGKQILSCISKRTQMQDSEES